jgi:hypothetical protein
MESKYAGLPVNYSRFVIVLCTNVFRVRVFCRYFGVRAATRFLRLMRRDFGLHKKAMESDNLDTTFIDRRIADLEGRVSKHSIPVNLGERVPGYEELVRLAATATSHDPDRWAYLRNAASGAAHGQN